VSLYGKFSLGLVFLLIAGAPLRAQSDGSDINAFQGDRCRDIGVTVTDINGIAIMGADVVTENNGLEIRTDSQGFAAIPCRSVEGRMLPVITVGAPGYRTTKVNLMPDSRSRLEVRLDRREPTSKSAGTTVNAAELVPNVQKQSGQLQQQAERAIAAKDFDNAERLLMGALQLTPSAAAIANNLGVVAMHKKDLETAASWFERASDEAPYKSDILGNLGLVRWMQQRAEESYAILTKAYSRGYESSLGNYILGTIGLKKRESKEAAEYLKKISPDRFPYRDFYLSIALRNCGKNKAADESFQSFIRHNPAPYLISQLR
jgi:hypothetical protein